MARRSTKKRYSTKKNKKSTKRRMSTKRRKSTKRRTSQYWKSPLRSARHLLYRKCGRKCFGIASSEKFPLCNPNCKYNCHAIHAAETRSGQYGYNLVNKRTKNLYKRFCAI